MTVDELVRRLSRLAGSAVVQVKDSSGSLLPIHKLELSDSGDLVIILAEPPRGENPSGTPSTVGGRLVTPSVSLPAEVPAGGGELVARSFAAIAHQQINETDVRKTKPHWLEFPDGERREVNTWRELAVAVLEWLGTRHRLPVPHPGRGRTDMWFLNTEPQHPSGEPFKEARTVIANEGTLYLDVKRNSGDTVHSLCRIIEELEEDPASFVVWFSYK